MSLKLQQVPQASTRSIPVWVRWTDLDGNTRENGFLNSWLCIHDDSDGSRRRFNWGALAGLAIAFVISGGFWAGVGVLIARAVK
jgi:hypothetical protein